jgi:hypothetical protein
MARIIEESELQEGDESERIYCSHCESAQFRLIGENMAECTVCLGCKAV